MRKFQEVLKTKRTLSENQREKNVLGSFKKIYAALLEKYNIAEFTSLDERNQPAFLAELHSYWDDKKGILNKGKKFLRGNSDMLNEASTVNQRKNFMKKKAIPAISETFKRSNLKYKLYDIIDEMYKNTQSKNLGDVLQPKEMIEILVESFRDSVKSIMTEIKYELHENAKPKVSKKKAKSIKEDFSGKNEVLRNEVANKLLGWLSDEGIIAREDGGGFIRDEDHNILASITPSGYVDVSGLGNFAPEELDDNMYDIIEGMKILIGGGYN